MTKRLKRNPEREVVFHAVLDRYHDSIGRSLDNGLYLSATYVSEEEKVVIRVTRRVDSVPDSG